MRKFNIHKALVLMAIVNVLLAILVISITVYIFTVSAEMAFEPERLSLPVISLLAFCSAVITVMLLRPMASHNLRLRQTEQSLDDLNKLNNTMRAQRHDFLNHLQVVHSLIELNEHTEANAYIDKVYDAIEKVSSSLRTSIPAVNAILEAKRQAAEKKGIDVSIEISSTLSEMPVPDWELCKLFGNIIDNSINALSEICSDKERLLIIELFEDIHSFKFKISNNGPIIPQERWDQIFETGFTTRVRGGEGMGLSICRDIMGKYNGKIWVISDEYETVFEGFVPRRNQ
ncbi:MAG: Spo0B domain-containing protein [Oscillospiraceae bacterium]|nr:Spo0B domain-containing protein [Oscillospiraceae bacterium]